MKNLRKVPLGQVDDALRKACQRALATAAIEPEPATELDSDLDRLANFYAQYLSVPTGRDQLVWHGGYANNLLITNRIHRVINRREVLPGIGVFDVKLGSWVVGIGTDYFKKLDCRECIVWEKSPATR